MNHIILKAGREESVQRHHPWIFSGAIAHLDGAPVPGETVEVRSAEGHFLARGAYSPASQISVRIWSFNPQEEITSTFIRQRLERAINSRKPAQNMWQDHCGRLIYGESDGLPGLIVDRYADFLVCQFLSAAAEVWKDTIVHWLSAIVPCRGIYERSDSTSREKEGLGQRVGLIRGDEPEPLVKVRSGPYHFWVDLRQGHKTGFYLDQSDNRVRISQYLSGLNVLDCFAYTGGFTVAALKAGAERVTCLDSSAEAIGLAQKNIELNGLNGSQIEFCQGNAFQILRDYQKEGREFEAMILDPPKFAASKADLKRAGRGYKDINLLACRLLRAGGILATFSCSQNVNADLFQKMISYAALDSGRDVQILEWLHQAADHPMHIQFPEANYLKGLICRIF